MVIQRGKAAVVVGNPEGIAGDKSDSPGIHEFGVRVGRHPSRVRYQIGLLVAVRLRVGGQGRQGAGAGQAQYNSPEFLHDCRVLLFELRQPLRRLPKCSLCLDGKSSPGINQRKDKSLSTYRPLGR